ncbi:MAG: anhydro-N-acetylmuramic acid kinase [Cellvibrionaceae bacterium]
MVQTELYIGLMSGTSADAIDAALLDFNDGVKLIATHSHPLSEDLQQDIHELALAGENEIHRCCHLDIHLAEAFAQTVKELLKTSNVSANQITAIGSHGQTIRHQPPIENKKGFSLQIADPNTIAAKTGITTIADFRRRDMAEGGQGAPLVPAFHEALFRHPSLNRTIVNIGGMGNITLLPSQQSEKIVSGFDTGPGNVLMDMWCRQHRGSTYDKNGDWARNGSVNEKLLAQLLSEPYFQQAAPKSTGRELFNHHWLMEQLEKFDESTKPEGIQATLLALTAHSICNAIREQQIDNEEVFICGGGAHNKYLMETLQALLPNQKVHNTGEIDLDPQWVEATAFAWLAKQTLEHLPGNLPAVTGASKPCILGGIYQA